MKKIEIIKNNIINFILPANSKRRLSVQYIYRLLNNKSNLANLKEKVKEIGIKKAIKYSFNQLVITTSREYQDVRYKQWIKNNTLTNQELNKQKNEVFEYKPLISIITVINNTKIKIINDYLKSIKEQTYDNWELYLVDISNSKNINIQQSSKIQYKKINNKTISECYNETLTMIKGEWVSFIKIDDILEKTAFYEIVKELNNHKECEMTYTDEDMFENSLKNRYNPFFKPDFSPDFLRSNNYIGNFAVISTSLVNKIGKFRKEFDAVREYDLYLRIMEKTNNIIHIPNVLYHVRKTEVIKDNTEQLGKEVIQDYLNRLKIAYHDIESTKQLGLNLYHIKYKIKGNPLISIIIPNKDSIKYLNRAVKSILQSNYKNYEIIIVENNSKNRKTFKYYDKISKNNKIKIVYYKDKVFNYSAINNYAVNYAKGEYILLLNNDIEVINKEWLEEMLSICQREDVGAVGAKLLYKDNLVQHIGVVVGMGGIAGHVDKMIKDSEIGYHGRAVVVNNYSAVTAACLMTKKELYKKVNGLDERFKVAFNDIDFCMKIRKENKLIVYTPYAKLYHYESRTRGYEDTPEKQQRFNNEIQLFERKWKSELNKKDSYFNKNLDLYSEKCEINIKNK